MLFIYAIFHGNLGFSSIPKDQYAIVLDRCYWPLLDIVEQGYKIGIEYPATTIEILNDIDPSYVKKLGDLWDKNQCDLIGSSAVQAVMPLIPYHVNKMNLKWGINIYRKYFSKTPKVFFLNEQTYSAAIPSLLLESGYEAMIMDWDNASEYHQFPQELRYQPTLVSGSGEAVIPVIWNSSLNSYKFQRCIYQRIDMDEYLNDVKRHYEPKRDRFLSIYGTDVEIFDYRPVPHNIIQNEIKKISQLFNKINHLPKTEMILPSEVIEKHIPQTIVSLETAEAPLPCKNRDDYNVLRWAVSGREDGYLNSQCYEFYYRLIKLDQKLKRKDCLETWKLLVRLWASDYRTRTIDEKMNECHELIGVIENKLQRLELKQLVTLKINSDDCEFILYNPTDQLIESLNYVVSLSFSPNEKMLINSYVLVCNNNIIKSQIENVEFYRDGSLRSCHIIFPVQILPFETKIFNLEPELKKLKQEIVNKDMIETNHVKAKFSYKTGGDLNQLYFKNLSDDFLIGYLPPVYYDHIGHSKDYYSGGVLLVDEKGNSFNDTSKAQFNFLQGYACSPIRQGYEFIQDLSFGRLSKRWWVYQDMPRIDLNYDFYLNDIRPFFFRIGIFTLNPKAFNGDQLVCRSINGGCADEKYALTSTKVEHIQSPSYETSGKMGIGATEGWVAIEDRTKGILFYTNKSQLYSIPMLEYEEVKGSYVCRLYHSISETDETGNVRWRGKNSISFSLIGYDPRDENPIEIAKKLSDQFVMISKKSDA